MEPRPLPVRGDPGPFGLLCFGMTTNMLMFITMEWTPGGFNTAVLAFGIFMGGVGQLLVGTLELIRGSVFAGTAVTSYGTFWLGSSLWHYWERTGQLPDVSQTALTGDTLWCAMWGVVTVLYFVITLNKNTCFQVIFASLFITFFLLAAGNYSHSCKLAAGYFGFFCGCSAIYTGIALLYKIELGWDLPGLKPTKYLK